MREATTRWARRLALVAAGAVAAGCSRPAEKPAATAFDSSLSTMELMEHVVDPTAGRFWAGSGTVLDRQGLHQRAPTTPEGWKSVEDGAAGVIEAGNLLLLPQRVREPRADWDRRAHDLTAIGREALAAADRKDEPAMLAIGSRMYEVCKSCHDQFMSAAQRGLTPPPAPSATAKPG